MPLSLSEIQEIIEHGDPLKLVGEFEGKHLDAKSQPYVFTAGDHVRRELAKDVTAFANAEGGCIVIGAETAVSGIQSGEQISGLRPFPDKLFVPDQLDKIITEWVYPRPRGVIFPWYPDASDQTQGRGQYLSHPKTPETNPFSSPGALERRRQPRF